MDAQEVIALLNERAEEFCRWVYPNGKKSGAFWEIGNIQGDPGDSLRIHISGEMVGRWADYGRGDEDAKGATLVHLLMYCRRTTGFGKCLVECKEWLGLEITPDEDRWFRERGRNGGKFETAEKNYVRLNPDGPVFRYLTEERRISPATLERYRVAEHRSKAEMCFAQLGENGRSVTFAKYVAVARRPDGSKIEYSNPVGASPGVWGRHAVDDEADEVVVTEGEIDAMSVAETGFAAVSMPNGAKNDKWIERDYRWLERFRSVILCFDPDAAGTDGLNRAFPKLVARIGQYRCRVARMPEGVKDPNDAIQQGRINELTVALNAAESVDPQPLKSLAVYEQKVRDHFFPPPGAIPGLPLPWTPRLRFRPGETTLWTGINGHGKTTALLHCITHLAQSHGERAIIACMEASPHKSAIILSQQTAGREINNEPFFAKVYGTVQERIWTYDRVGNVEWRELIDTFRYAWRRYGVSQFVIDSMMTTNIDTDDYNAQSTFIGALAEFADESQGHLHVVAHARKGKDEDAPPGKMDVAGHANLTNRAFNGLTVFRNKDKIGALQDAAESRDKKQMQDAQRIHDAELVCWKQRETGDEFIQRLWFHRPSLQFWPDSCPQGRSYLT